MTRPNDNLAAGGNFPPTRISVIAGIRSGDAAQRSDALDSFCLAYWKPVYKYIRLRFLKPPEEAQDLTQAFFIELLERDLLSRFDAGKSRLRTYIRLCVDSLVLNEIKHRGRQKRGGEAIHLALDFAAAEGEFNRQAIDPAAIPAPDHFEEYFEKEWIRSLFASAVEDLKELGLARGKQTAFALFEAYDLSEDENRSYAQLAAEHGISPVEVTNQLAWSRREFRRLARERLRALSATEEEYARESKSLFGGEG